MSTNGITSEPLMMTASKKLGLNILHSVKKRVTLIDMSKNIVPSPKMMCMSCMPMMMGMCCVTSDTKWGEVTLD